MRWASGVVSRWAMQADEVLDNAKEILLERQIRYDDFAITAYRTASLQSIIHEERRTAENWCIDMAITKLARIYASPKHLDNYLDAICYLAQAAALIQTSREEIL